MTIAIRRSTSPSGETVYWPNDRPPRGGVVCLHGSDGGFAGWNDGGCALLAADGFVALAHSYSQAYRPGRTPDIDGAPLDGTEAALTFLKRELAPHRCGVGLFGYSRGAEHLKLAVDRIPCRAEPGHLWVAVLAGGSTAEAVTRTGRTAKSPRCSLRCDASSISEEPIHAPDLGCPRVHRLVHRTRIRASPGRGRTGWRARTAGREGPGRLSRRQGRCRRRRGAWGERRGGWARRRRR